MIHEQENSLAVLDALVAALQKKTQYNRNDQIAPAVILWPDRAQEWRKLIPQLRQRLPALLELGEYDPANWRGPAIWVRCMLARALPKADWPENEVPILYLAGVSRRELRAIETCPKHLQPLAELQYRGEYFSQSNGKDWTVLAFLKSRDGGLGLDVAQDEQTRAAISRAVTRVAETPVAYLRARRLEASDFDELLVSDTIRDLLLWLNDPVRTREQWQAERWSALCARCRKEYDFDPEKDGELVGAEKLGYAQPPWDKVWARFGEAPGLYPNLPGLLQRATPSELFLQGNWPKLNEEGETNLRKALHALEGKAAPETREEIIALEQAHGQRRATVWAKLKQAPLAEAMAPLAKLAEMSAGVPSFTSLEQATQWYTETGWQADAAALAALQDVRSAQDCKAVKAALRAVYGEWLQELAARFQECVMENGYPKPERMPEAETGTCILFVDGLRFDLGMQLVKDLQSCGYDTETQTRLAALPTVTATAKPAQSPVALELCGNSQNEEFQVEITASGKTLTQTLFRKLLQEAGWQTLDAQECGDAEGKAWTECGTFDRYGHDQGWKLAWRIQEEIAALAERIQRLLQHGWQSVQVRTDHGWLLLPGGLPKRDLPAFLTTTRWGRCALLKPAARYSGPLLPWHWNESLAVAYPVGAGVFYSGQEYAHGGVSLQECLLPVITVASRQPAVTVTLETPVWLGLRCRVSVQNSQPGFRADLRTGPADSVSSIVSGGRTLDAEGKASLLVEDENLEGSAVHLVLLDAQERVIARKLTTVGGE